MSLSTRTLYLGLLLLGCAWSVAEGRVNATFFMEKLLEEYGTGEHLNASQAEALLNRVRQFNAGGPAASGHGVTLQARPAANCSFQDATCLSTKCLSAAELFDFHQVPQDGADVSQVSALVPGLLYQLQNEACANGTSEQDEEEHVGHGHKKPTSAHVWGYGFLSVTIINICPVLGIFFHPLMKTKIYRKVLMCTVGFAVGTLSASAILVLIPEGFELLTDASPFQDIFRWRGLVVIAGLFIFFNIERALSYIFQKKERAVARAARMASLAMNNKGFDDDARSGHAHELRDISERRHSHAVLPPAVIVPKWAPSHTIKPVAWMIIIGDALHNFMDGLSIGSAFTESNSAGLGISLAIFSEELPHELGDFAVLLNAGMSIRQAAVMNFISAISCYLGLFAGIQIGEIDDGAYWVFALTGGMFLYISLVEMLPEMNDQAKEEEELTGHVAAVFIIQNVGLVVGWLIIFLVSYYSVYFPA